VVFVGEVAEIEVDIDVIALPTVALRLERDVATSSGVVKVDVVEVVPAPLLLAAVVVTEYVVPGASPLVEIVVVVDVSVTAAPPPRGVRVAEYSVIDAPPVDVGAVTVIIAVVAVVAAAEVIEGAEGGAAGVVMVDEAAVAPSPTAFVARVVIAYVVPGVNPVRVTALAICAAVTVNVIGVPPPVGVAMISYSVMVDPPLFVAAPMFIVAVVAVAADALTVAGAPGTVAGVTAAEAAEAADPPLMLFATTL
jgi:hypothetical protein